MAVERLIRRRVLELHLVEADIELVREQLRLGRVRALPHLDVRQSQGGYTSPVNADEGVRGKSRAAGAPVGCRRETKPDEQASARRGNGREEGAPRLPDAAAHEAPPPFASSRFAACRIAARMRP